MYLLEHIAFYFYFVDLHLRCFLFLPFLCVYQYLMSHGEGPLHNDYLMLNQAHNNRLLHNDHQMLNLANSNRPLHNDHQMHDKLAPRLANSNRPLRNDLMLNQTHNNRPPCNDLMLNLTNSNCPLRNDNQMHDKLVARLGSGEPGGGTALHQRSLSN